MSEGKAAEMPRVLAVIPVYNHASTLAQVVRGVLAVHPELLVVDDGSSDEGLAALGELESRVATLAHEHNMGKGAAILTAAQYAHEHGFSHIVTIDADAQHDPADLPSFLPLLQETPDCIVVGARDFSGPNIPNSSRFGRKFSNFWLRVQTGEPLSDVQCGFRAYSVAVLRGLHLHERRYSFEVEVLVKAAWAGFPLREVPVKVHYPPREERISHFRALYDNLLISLLNTRLTARAFLPLPHRRMCRDASGAISPIHPLRSLRTLLAAHNTPRTLALSGALGVLVGAFPIFGFHCIVLILLTSFLRLSKITALATNQLCIPPLVPALCIEAGHYLLNGRLLTEISLQTLGYEAHLRLLEWLLGALVVGPAMALLLGGTIWAMALCVRAGLAPNKEHG